MQMAELRKKSEADLLKLLPELREKTRSLKFRIGSKEVKNYNELKFVKKDIARILTILKEKERRV